MTATSSTGGGKRKVNKGLKCWVAFVKKVQKEEKLSYKDAIHRAKQRKDKGEKWMKGGDMDGEVIEEVVEVAPSMSSLGEPTETFSSSSSSSSSPPMMGGKSKRRTAKRSSKRRSGGKSKRRGATKRRSRGIARSRSAR